MKIVIYGTGGVGGYFGARLCQAGYDVTFIARGKHLEAIKKNGLQLKSIQGDYLVNPVQATNTIEEVKNPDLIILAVKSWQLEEVSKSIQLILQDNTMVLPLLNGISNVDTILSVIDKKYVLGGLCRIISKIESPGVINHIAFKPSIDFGELDNKKSERVLQLKAVFDKAGIFSTIVEDIDVAIWTKFLFITTVSAIGGLTRASIGVMRNSPAIRKIMMDTAREIYTIALAKGIQLDEKAIEKQFKIIDAQPFETTASLQRDIMEGKPSELEAQNGTVVKLGKELNIPTPVNSFIYECLLPQENKARGIQQ